MIGKTMLFNPFNGWPRHPDDIKSDPAGLGSQAGAQRNRRPQGANMSTIADRLAQRELWVHDLGGPTETIHDKRESFGEADEWTLFVRQPAPIAEPPNCGACPGDGTICPSTCKLADESPPIAEPAAKVGPGWTCCGEFIGGDTCCGSPDPVKPIAEPAAAEQGSGRCLDPINCGEPYPPCLECRKEQS